MAEWVKKFFAGTRSASISAIYNENAGSGSARKEAVRRRLDEVGKSYDEFFKKVLTCSDKYRPFPSTGGLLLFQSMVPLHAIQRMI